MGTERKKPDQSDPPAPSKAADLSRWNLSDLYPGRDSPEFKQALTDLDDQ